MAVIRLPRFLRWAGLAITAWAFLPPFTPPDLGTSLTTEIIDHAVPAALIGVVLAVATARAWSAFALFNLGLAVVTLGLFMVGTHIPLVAQAIGGDVGWWPTAYHTSAPIAVLAFGTTWTIRFRTEGQGED